MDKPNKQIRGTSTSGKKSHLHPSASDLIALGSKRPDSSGSGHGSSIGGNGSSGSGTASRSLTSSSSSSKSTGLKREGGSGLAPPAKKVRIASSIPHQSTSGSGSGSKSTKQIRRDPLDLTPTPTTSAPINISDLTSDKFFSVLEKADKTGNCDVAQNLILAGLKRLRSSNAKEKEQLQICQNFLLVAKTYPYFFQIPSIIDNLVYLVHPKPKDLGVKLKQPTQGTFATFALIVLSLSHAQEPQWPASLVNLWMEDASGDRNWVDLPMFKAFVENFLLSFGTILPSTNLLLVGDGGGGGSGGGSSPNPLSSSTDDSSLGEELKKLVEENKDLLDSQPPVMNRFAGQESEVESRIVEYATDIVHKRSPDIPKNLLKALEYSCGLSGVRAWVVGKIEQWLHNGKSGRAAQELLLHLCINANCNTSADAEVVNQISKLRMKTKPLVHFYSVALREMVRDNETNMRNVLNQIIYNELSPQRNPNNLPLLGSILSGVPEARTILADIFMDLLQKREDFHPALRLLLREIVRSARYECDLTKFVMGLIKHRDITWLGECRERAFLAIADLILLSMFLSVSPQVREASAVAAVRGEPKDISTLTNFRSLVSAIQNDAVSWMYSVVPKMFRTVKANYTSALHKILLKDPVNDLVTKDGWPPESEKNLFGRLCLEIGLHETSLVFVLMMGMSKDHPLSPNEALDLVEQVICRSAAHKTGLNLQKIEIIELLFRLTEYRHPDNISLPLGYDPPRMAVSNFYWRAWGLLCIISSFNPVAFGKVGWADYPTLKVFMEMCMTNSFTFPTASITESETSEGIISRELQTVAMEKEEILEFESHLAAASSKTPITESSSHLLSQLMRMDPFGAPRTPPTWILTQLQTWNEQMNLGHQLCRSRNPDFLLDLIQRNSEPMPWLSRLVSEGSFEILPDQCLCEFMMGHMDDLDKALALSRHEDTAPGRSPKKTLKGNLPIDLGLSKDDTKLLQLLHYLQEKVQGVSEEAKKVLEYFLRRISVSKMHQRNQALKALKMLLIKTEDEVGAGGNGNNSEDWLIDCLPTLPIFSEMQETVLVLLRQAIQMENEPSLVASYLEFLSTWTHLTEDMDGLAFDVAGLVVERNGLISTMMSKYPNCFQSLFDIFSNFMKKIREPRKETYKWSESQDQVLVQWPVEGLEGTMNILVIHAVVIILSSYSSLTQSSIGSSSKKRKDLKYSELLDVWFPKVKENFPKGFLLNTSEEAILYPDWIKLRMIRSNNSRLLGAALEDLDVDQLMLFIQHFGVPVQSMTALLYCLDKVSEQKPEQVVSCMVNAPYMHTLVQLQWKRGASGGEKFVNILKTRCGVTEPMDCSKSTENVVATRTPFQLGPIKDKDGGKKGKGQAQSRLPSRDIKSIGGSSQLATSTYSPLPEDKRKSVEHLSKELLRMSSPPSNRRRSSVPVSKGDEFEGHALRRHSSYLDEKLSDRSELQETDRSPSKYLGELVDQITEVEPCIVRNALEFQLPLLFGKSENSSSARSFLMTALAHQSGWETIHRCLNLFLKEFDSKFDSSAILDLMQATNTNPKLWQGVDKYVPKHQPSLSVMHLTSSQLEVMAEYIIEEISQMEMKGTKFSISNLLGPMQSQPSTTPKKSKQGLQARVRLWIQCGQQDKTNVDFVIKSLMEKKWRNPCVKRFVNQVYVEFPEVILVDNWRWKADEMNMTEDEVSSLLDSISHGLITALANTQPGKDWAKKQAHDYEICLRKLASLHPTLLLRQLNLMGSLLEGRVHLESLAFHQQNHNLPFVVYLALFDLMRPHILRHFKQLKSTFLLYIKMFKNYGTTKDYSSSFSRFSILLHNFLSVCPNDVKEFLNPHYTILRELSSFKYYTEVIPLQNLIGCLVPPSGPTVSSNNLSSGGIVSGANTDFLTQTASSMNDRLIHASNDEEMIPVLQELDALSNRNPNVLNKFSENLNSLLKSESESCRTLAFSLALKHSSYFPSGSSAYLDTILQLLEDENSHLRETMMDRIHEFVILAQERGEDILIRMFQLGISSNANFLTPIQKSMALLRNYSSLA